MTVVACSGPRDEALTNPYLEPVAPTGAHRRRHAAGRGDSRDCRARPRAVRRCEPPASRRALTSSSVVFALILLALDGICWQAGVRLTFRRRRQGTLFSRPTWFVIGAALIVMAVLMAATIPSARSPTLVDYQVVLSLGAFGIWCIVLSCVRELTGGRWSVRTSLGGLLPRSAGTRARRRSPSCGRAGRAASAAGNASRPCSAPTAAPTIAAIVSLSCVSLTARTIASSGSCAWRARIHSTLGTVSSR